MLKQLYKDAEKIFVSLYKQKYVKLILSARIILKPWFRVEQYDMNELAPVLFETIANDLMLVKNGYRMDQMLKMASQLKLMEDKSFMDYIQVRDFN